MVSWSSCPLAVAWILLIHLQQSSSPSPPVLRHLPATEPRERSKVAVRDQEVHVAPEVHTLALAVVLKSTPNVLAAKRTVGGSGGNS